MVLEHLHAAPGCRWARTGSCLGQKRLQQLPHARAFDGQQDAHHPQRRSAPAEDGAGAVGSDHFAIAHINEPSIAVIPCHLACDGQNHVRIDRSHRPAHDLKLFSRIFGFEQHFQVASEAITWIGVAQHGGFPEEKNPNGAGRFHGKHAKGNRRSRNAVWKEAKTELIVRNEVILALNPRLEQEGGGIAIPGKAQDQLTPAQQQQRRQGNSRNSEKPNSPGRLLHVRRSRLRVRGWPRLVAMSESVNIAGTFYPSLRPLSIPLSIRNFSEGVKRLKALLSSLGRRRGRRCARQFFHRCSVWARVSIAEAPDPEAAQQYNPSKEGWRLSPGRG